MQRIRDNPTTAEQELASIKNNNHALQVKYNFNIKPDHYIFAKKKPRAAILREQGTNGHIEMAAALMRAGFECVDVHINDIIFKQKSLDQFKFLSFCGGFSYGDVLGAGRGFASRILYNRIALKVFTDFFNRPDTLTLGVCNGCQVLSHLKSIIPGAGHWPMFINNQSEQFEARLSLVKIIKSQSILLNGLADSVLPIVVSHGEGRVNFNNNLNDAKNLKILQHHNLIAMQFVDSQGIATIDYPANPNGSIAGITGLCSDDGRVTLMMPHPERVFRKAQFSWFEEDFEQSDDSPWMRMFYEAYIHAVID
jgi:phosphoribosylformylglycinamidine synthase